jgi:hypothetical protein
MAGAPSGKRVLVQRATKNEFNVIVAPGFYVDDSITAFDDLTIRGKTGGG